MDCSPPALLSMQFSRHTYWSGLPCPPPGELPDPGIKPKSPVVQVDSLPTEPPRKPRAPKPTFRAFSSVQSLSRVQLSVTPWTVVCQASLSITNSQSLFKLMSIASVIPSNHLILCPPLLLLPSIFPSNRVFSKSQFFTSGGQSLLRVRKKKKKKT